MLRGLRQRTTGIARTLLALALLATLVRAVLPAGYMVAAGRSGLIEITLCTGHGAETAFLDLKTGDIVPEDEASASDDDAGSVGDDSPCAFSSLAQLALPDAAPSLAAALFAEAPASTGVDALRPGRGLAAPPPWSTGPPHIA